MGTSQTGVPGDLAMFLALVVLKCDLGTVPIHRRSTMALIAKDLAMKCSYATYSLVQVQYQSILNTYTKEKTFERSFIYQGKTHTGIRL